jgi:hypothetical protein
MPGSRGSESAAPAVISRRDAIVGALALAAGSLLASKPELALAANGDPMHVGTDMVSTTWTSITRRDLSANDLSYAFLNHSFGAQQVAVYGGVTAVGAAESMGVYGLASLAGQYGVQAENTDGGTALKVMGKAEFQTSGRSSVSKGSTTKTVTGLAGIASTSMILVTLQGDAGSGVVLRYATRVSSTSFKVVLNKAATKKVAFAWFILG